MNKNLFNFIKYSLFVISLVFVNFSSAYARNFSVGVSLDDADNIQFNQLLNLINIELAELSSDDLVLSISKKNVLNGKNNLQFIADNNQLLLNDSSIDMILELGVLSSNSSVYLKNLNKPVFSPIVIDYKQQGFKQIDGKSSKPNLVFLSSFRSFVNDITEFKELVNFSSLAIILDKSFKADTKLLDRLKKALIDPSDFAVEIVFYDSDIQKFKQKLSSGFDAAYVTPLPLMESDLIQVFDVLKSLSIPSFAMLGKDYVEKGALLATADQVDFKRLARRIAIVIQQLALGVPATDISGLFVQNESLCINMNTANKVGYSPEWGVLNEAELIDLDIDTDNDSLSFLEAINIAEKSNLELEHTRQNLAILEQDINIARSNLYPTLKLDLARIDVDKEHVSPYQYQHETKATLTVSQVLFSDMANAGIDIQEYLRQAEQAAVDAKRLDVIYEASHRYIEALYLKTLLNVKKENLKLTRSNLGLAKLRESIGYSRLSDVYRWENKLATDRKSFDETHAQYLQLLNKLNEILNQTQSKQYSFEDIDVSSSYFLLNNQQIFDYIQTPQILENYKAYSVENGVNNAYEINQIELSLKSLERLVVNKKRNLWMPEVAFRGQVNEALSQKGDGGQLLVGKDDTSWNAALVLSWKLTQGGAKIAELSKAELEYGRLLTEKIKAEKSIELRIRSSMHKLLASYLGIENSKKAYNAAEKNLNLVQDAYVKGSVSVLDLIDAQHVANISKESVAGSKYQFLLDYIAYQRAISKFFFKMNNEQQKLWLKQFSAYKQE